MWSPPHSHNINVYAIVIISAKKFADCRNTHSHRYIWVYNRNLVDFVVYKYFFGSWRNTNKRQQQINFKVYAYVHIWDNRKHFKLNVWKYIQSSCLCVYRYGCCCCWFCFSFLSSRGSSVNVSRPEDVHNGMNVSDHCWLYFRSRIPLLQCINAVCHMVLCISEFLVCTHCNSFRFSFVVSFWLAPLSSYVSLSFGKRWGGDCFVDSLLPLCARCGLGSANNLVYLPIL